jgi:hypothetical protein
VKSQKKTADWQIKQAEEALRLYFHHFLDTKTAILSPDGPQKGALSVSKVLSNMRQALRIRHYSYRTELSYLEWAQRPMDYTSKVKKKNVRAAGLPPAPRLQLRDGDLPVDAIGPTRLARRKADRVRGHPLVSKLNL